MPDFFLKILVLETRSKGQFWPKNGHFSKYLKIRPLFLDPRLCRRGPINSAPFVRSSVRSFVTRFSQNPFVSFSWFFAWSFRVINEQKWRSPIFFENSCCPGNGVKRSFLAQKLTFFKISQNPFVTFFWFFFWKLEANKGFNLT